MKQGRQPTKTDGLFDSMRFNITDRQSGIRFGIGTNSNCSRAIIGPAPSTAFGLLPDCSSLVRNLA
jgi:hypothetical protein